MTIRGAFLGICGNLVGTNGGAATICYCAATHSALTYHTLTSSLHLCHIGIASDTQTSGTPYITPHWIHLVANLAGNNYPLFNTSCLSIVSDTQCTMRFQLWRIKIFVLGILSKNVTSIFKLIEFCLNLLSKTWKKNSKNFYFWTHFFSSIW